VAAAATAQPQSSSQSSSQIPDYVFSQSIIGTNLAYLYPDMDWFKNPSNALQFDKKVLWPYLNYTGSTTKTTLTNLAQSAFPGGTQVTTTNTYSPTADIAGYMPFGKNMVGGAELYFSSLSTPGSVVRTNYTAATQNITTTTAGAFSPTLLAVGTFGMNLGGIGLGLSASYQNVSTQAKNQFNTISDAAVLSGATYYSAGGAYSSGASNYTSNDGTISATAGAHYSFGKLRAGLGVNFSSETIDMSTGLIAVDETGNGYRQTLVDINTFETSTQPWGAALAYYSHKNTESLTNLNLYPSATYELSPKLTVLASGFWKPVGTDNTITYTRTASTDKNQSTTSYNSGLGTFEAVGGVKYMLFPNLELRAGGGYSLSSTNYSTDTLNVAGTTTYTTGNSNHYAEVPNFAGNTDPTNGQVQATAGGIPTNKQVGTIIAVVGAKWSPFPKLAFFATASLTDPETTNTYYAFNTTTGKVWSEVQKTGGLNWSIGGVAGLAFQLTPNFTLATYTTALSNLGLSGTTTTGSDGLPSSGGTTSANLTGTSSVTTGSSFNAFLTGILTL